MLRLPYANFTRIGIATVIASTLALSMAACSSNNAPKATSQPVASAAPLPSTDPVVQNAGDGILLGSGWYPLEHFKGDTFHWATNDAEVTACPDANARTLALQLEPGPGITGAPAPVATISITGNHGDHAKGVIKGRQYLKVTIAYDVPAETFTIHADSANHVSPNGDKRILNYRLMSAVLGSSIADCKKAIVRDGSPLALGTGWFKYETFAGSSFHWVNNNAQFKLTQAQAKPFVLELRVAAGPSLGGAPLKLTLHDQRGRAFTPQLVKPVVYPQVYAAFSLPAEPDGATLTLSAPSKNVAVADPRKYLNFRVFDAKIKP